MSAQTNQNQAVKSWKHPDWGKIQLRYFGPNCKIIREKNIEDFIVNNGIKTVHLVKDNTILDDFILDQGISVVDPTLAELVVITDQRFSRLSPGIIISKLQNYLDSCSRIYFALNRYYLNANESFVDPNLPEHYDTAIVRWLEDNLKDVIVLNISEIFQEDGAHFTWVVPSCELLICKK